MKKIALFLLFGLFLACSSDPESRNAPAGTVLMTLNGTEMLSVSATAVVTSASVSGNPRAAIDATYSTPTGNYTIRLSASTQNIFEPLVTGEYLVEGKDVPGNSGIIYYAPAGASASNAYSSMYVGTDVAGKIVITSIDAANKLISGTFECTIAHFDNGQTLSITAGAFTQIPYIN